LEPAQHSGVSRIEQGNVFFRFTIPGANKKQIAATPKTAASSGTKDIQFCLKDFFFDFFAIM
jgi:hypothetical protein